MRDHLGDHVAAVGQLHWRAGSLISAVAESSHLGPLRRKRCYSGLWWRPMVDSIERRVASRRLAPYPVQHVLAVHDGSRYFRTIWIGPNRHHLHDGRRRRIPVEFACWTFLGLDADSFPEAGVLHCRGVRPRVRPATRSVAL